MALFGARKRVESRGQAHPTHRVEDALARERRPANLPPVEAELQMATGRRPAFVGRKGLDPVVSAVLKAGLASRAWVTKVDRSEGAEGRDVVCSYAFVDRARLFQGSVVAGLDRFDVHARPALVRWMDQALRHGGTFTVVFRPDSPERSYVVGVHEVHVVEPLADRLLALSSAQGRSRMRLLGEVGERLEQAMTGLFLERSDLRDELAQRIGRACWESPRAEPAGQLQQLLQACQDGRANLDEVRALGQFLHPWSPGRWLAN
jgi:hypothetical protein